jgi:small-conductance mechanosensitive channel
MDSIALALFFGLVARFVIRAWKGHGRLSGRDRWALITSFAVALTLFVVARLVINWVLVPTAIWLIAVALLAGGVVGAVLRWPELTWFSGTHPIRRAIGVGATLVSCALIIGVAVT